MLNPALHEAQQLLREQLARLLTGASQDLAPDVTQALHSRGKLLSDQSLDGSGVHSVLPAGVWPLLTFLIAQQISPDINLLVATNVAVATECYICALDLFDDVEDGDVTPTIQALGVTRTLPVATTLLSLANQALLDTAAHLEGTGTLRLLAALNDTSLTAICGQHRDLLTEQQAVASLSPQDCLEILTAKSGALMRLACLLGALAAGAPEEICNKVAELGELLGIAHQLDNDAHDLYDLLQDNASSPIPTGEVKSDLARGKKTLPIVLAADIYGASFQGETLPVEQEKGEYLRSLHEGIAVTTGLCLLYRECFRERLQEFEALTRPLGPALAYLFAQACAGELDGE